MQPPMACGILFLVYHVMHKKANLLATKIKNNSFIDDDGIEHYDDIKNNEEKKEKVANKAIINLDEFDSNKVNWYFVAYIKIHFLVKNTSTIKYMSYLFKVNLCYQDKYHIRICYLVAK